jgi:hypothetical protein
MAAARRRFPEDNRHGVFAFGIGPAIARGHRAGVALNVYVARKRDDVAPVRPLTVRDAGRSRLVRPNVVATGRPPHPSGGHDNWLDGLYCGASIRVEGKPRVYGGVACFVGTEGVATHFLTAGHLFQEDAIGTRVTAAKGAGGALVTAGRLAVNLLDDDGVDAAAVELTAEGAALVGAGGAGPTLSRVVADSAIWSRATLAFLPTARDYSRATVTTSGPMDVLLEAEARGTYWVRGAVGTDGAITDLGDSGTALCTGGGNDAALGLCVGEFQSHSIAEPLGRVLTKLQRTLGAVNVVPPQTG